MKYRCTKFAIIKYILCEKQPQLTDISCFFLALISSLLSFSTYSMFSVTVTLQPELSPDVIPEGT